MKSIELREKLRVMCVYTGSRYGIREVTGNIVRIEIVGQSRDNFIGSDQKWHNRNDYEPYFKEVKR